MDSPCKYGTIPRSFNELVFGILEPVLPDDIESISLASHRIYQRAIPLLEEHSTLRKQYTNFQNKVQNEFMNWHDPGGLLANLLCQIMSDFRIGHYFKRMYSSMWNYAAKYGWKPDEVFKPFTTSRTRLQQDFEDQNGYHRRSSFAPLRLYPQRRSLTDSIKFAAGVKIHSIRGAIQSPLVVIPAQIDPARRWAGAYRQAIFITLKDVEIQCAVRCGMVLILSRPSCPYPPLHPSKRIASFLKVERTRRVLQHYLNPRTSQNCMSGVVPHPKTAFRAPAGNEESENLRL